MKVADFYTSARNWQNRSRLDLHVRPPLNALHKMNSRFTPKINESSWFYTNARNWQNRSRLDFISWWPFCWSRDWITSSCFCCYEPSLIPPQITHFLGKNVPPHSVLWEKQTYYCQRDNIGLPDKGTTYLNFLLPFRWQFSFKQEKDRTAAPKLLLLPYHNL